MGESSSVEPPLNVVDATVAVGSHSVEESISQINGITRATHALVTDGGLDNVPSRALDAKAAAAVWVVVGQRAHQLIWQSDLHVAVGVDIPAAGAEATVPVRDVTGTATVWSLAGTA